ncbi:PAP7 [Symbiodinium necroappetens]|uniref:PAP7 protein n=1 Tax=Symbiodinium necroappetens TaxID=1628268 RepID=A0A812W9Y9_9DINO|nr:PAP7 [Symbiodinium necroappetens]
MGEPSRKVVVCTPSGRLIEVDFNKDGTVHALKEQLQSQVGESPARMILLCGDKVLQDDCKLDDTGSSSGLTLVMSSLPTGRFELFSSDEGPAGPNTTADVTAEFQSSGAFCITIKETEITSDDEDEDYDEYEAGAAWDHEYTGICVVDGHELKLAISDSKRMGRFEAKPVSTEFLGSLGSVTELKLQLPLAAGGCNRGTAGLTWLTLQKSG